MYNALHVVIVDSMIQNWRKYHCKDFSSILK